MTISGGSADSRALLLALGNKFLSLMSLHKQMFSWTDAVLCHSLYFVCGECFDVDCCAGKTLVTNALATLATQSLVTQHTTCQSLPRVCRDRCDDDTAAR